GWVSAIIMLFVLTPVAKLTRRFVYALVEQYDRGDPADQATAGLQYGVPRGINSAVAAGGVAAAGISAIGGMFRGGGGGGSAASNARGGGGGPSADANSNTRGGHGTAANSRGGGNEQP